ncbi:hypothetical protein NPIL_635411 [Nephila pilipes]|uniref:Uncharacterized protein n=1 Tax=Nephila pilipes TaxID=299642 RepID=A0A8X6U6B4_NEPPI|nr:hypothetical protein NPIL_635411 [Nephila pilipes]
MTDFATKFVTGFHVRCPRSMSPLECCAASHFFSITSNTSLIASLPVMKHGFIASPPPLKPQWVEIHAGFDEEKFKVTPSAKVATIFWNTTRCYPNRVFGRDHTIENADRYCATLTVRVKPSGKRPGLETRCHSSAMCELYSSQIRGELPQGSGGMSGVHPIQPQIWLSDFHFRR